MQHTPRRPYVSIMVDKQSEVDGKLAYAQKELR